LNTNAGETENCARQEATMPSGDPAIPGKPPDADLGPSNWALIGIFLIMAFGALSVAQGLFVPLVTALMLALVFSPVRRALGFLGIPPVFAASLIFIVGLGLLAALIYAASGTLASRIENAPELMERAEREVRQLLGSVQPMLDATEKISEMTGDQAEEAVLIRQPGLMSLAAKATPAVFGEIIITLTLAFFLIASGDLFYEKLVQIMPTFKDKRRALQIARDIEEQLSNYLFTISVINAVVAVLVGLTAWAFGLPDPVLFGVAAFLLNFIPISDRSPASRSCSSPASSSSTRPSPPSRRPSSTGSSTRLRARSRPPSCSAAACR
jgi:predicted PurR-regulated permease PerM